MTKKQSKKNPKTKRRRNPFLSENVRERLAGGNIFQIDENTVIKFGKDNSIAVAKVGRSDIRVYWKNGPYDGFDIYSGMSRYSLQQLIEFLRNDNRI